MKQCVHLFKVHCILLFQYAEALHLFLQSIYHSQFLLYVIDLKLFLRPNGLRYVEMLCNKCSLSYTLLNKFHEEEWSQWLLIRNQKLFILWRRFFKADVSIEKVIIVFSYHS